jgi:hypothetical protein
VAFDLFQRHAVDAEARAAVLVLLERDKVGLPQLAAADQQQVRSSVCLSWRILPGHGCALSHSSACGVMVAGGKP